MYNRRVGRWKLFGDVAQENSFSAAALRSMLQREIERERERVCVREREGWAEA